MSGSTVTSSSKVGFVQSTPRFIRPQNFLAICNYNNSSSTRLYSAALDAPITQDKGIQGQNKLLGRNDLLVQNLEKQLNIEMGKKSCIHPGKDPKCDDCPAKKSKFDAKYLEIHNQDHAKANSLFGKSQCIHPGKDPKCNDCPDKKSKFVMSNVEILQAKSKCAHPGKNPPCNNCPDKQNKFVMAQNENSLVYDKNIDIHLGQSKCAHPGKNPPCKNCPDKLNKLTMEENQIDISMGKTQCIHPNKTPKCNDCPGKLKIPNAVIIQDFENIFGKTKCVHPGKDPKCNDCPDRKKNDITSYYMPPNRYITQSLQKLIQIDM